MRFRSMLVVAAFASVAAFAGAQESAVGTWDVTMDFGGRQVEGKVIIEEKDGALTGKWSSQRGESELSDVKLEEGKLTFLRKLERQGQSFELPFEGKIEGDKLTGAFVTPQGEMPVTGKRAGGAEPATPAGESKGIVGTWNITSESQLGTLKRKLIVKPDMTASYESEDAKFPVKNLKVAEDDVTFDVTVSAQGQDLPLAFKGKLDGDKLKGNYLMDGQEVATVTGDREKAGPAGGASGVFGTYDVTSESALGTLKRKLTINPDMTGTYDTGEEKFPLKNVKVDGDNITFDVTVSIDGNDLPLKFTGKSEGGNITGKFASEAGDATVTGKKQ